MDPTSIKDLILNINYPCVLQDIVIPWKCFESTLDEWCSDFDESCPKGVFFTEAETINFEEPQYEVFRKTTDSMTMKEFLDFSRGDNSSKWISYSYKYLRDCPGNLEDGIDFSVFGFPEIKEDIAMWLGSAGAHTPCHYDTMGRNVVVQVFGKKRWILFKPDTKLHPTRIPFEETSVYCTENFFSPNNLQQFAGLQPFVVDLGPGDILIIPPRWWHYVENLEPSLAFNAWISIDDYDQQIEECIVKSLICKLMINVEKEIKPYLLYPIELVDCESLECKPIDYFYNIIKFICERKHENEELYKTQPDRRVTAFFKTNYFSVEQVASIVGKYAEHIKAVPQQENEIFLVFLMNINSQRFSSDSQMFPEYYRNRSKIQSVTDFVNSVCCETSVRTIKHNILKIINNQN